MTLTALEAQLRASEARNEAILKASLDAIIVMNHEGKFVEFNPAAEAILGFSRADVLNKTLADIIIPERFREQHKRGLAHYLATGDGPAVNRRIEMSALRASGEEFPVELAIVPVAGSDPPLFAGFLRDITDRKRAEERQVFLMNELAHRGRNLLAVVRSIATRTFSGAHALDESGEIFKRRIDALARAHTALTPDGAGRDIADIIRMEFEAFTDRVEMGGPTIPLSARAAQALSLLVHELATNAAKHGALSQTSGRVEVRWNVEGDSDAARFKFFWHELGGPPVVNPSHTGFGSIVLEKIVAQEFRTKPEIEYAPQGLRYSLDAPLAAAMSD
jgi:PAS domain S-box-containing protein